MDILCAGFEKDGAAKVRDLGGGRLQKRIWQTRSNEYYL
jgi:hypothetical protein